MSKKTHKKASKPNVGAKVKSKAKTKATAKSKVRAKAGSKVKASASKVTVGNRSSAAGASKAPSAKKAGKKATSAVPSSGKKTSPAKQKASANALAGGKSRSAVRKVAKPSAVKPTHVDIASERPQAGLAVGSKVPSFQLTRDGGATVSLESFAGRKLVIFFYPRASTPGCTKEAMDFSRLSDAFAARDTDVIGISADPRRAQETFRDKHDLTMPLLSDEAHTVLEAFGVWGDKTLYGKVFQGILRTTVLVGSDGRVINIWRNVKVDGHAEAVLKYVENL